MSRARTLFEGPRSACVSTLVGLPSISRTEALDSAELDALGATQVMEHLQPGLWVEGTGFRVVRLLGSGGMGDVYEVSRGEEERHFALKLLRPAHRGRRDLAERMRDEGRLLEALGHENVVRLLEAGCVRDGRPYLLMELLSGLNLKKELERVSVFSVVAALGITAQALDGLCALHQAGFVHRDVKLQNLFLCDEGRVKVLDFGIAKDISGRAGHTGHGFWVGTSRVMAPEQHAGGRVDARTDVYGAGLVLYELVTGRGPFDAFGANDRAMRYAHCVQRVPAMSCFAPQAIPGRLEAIVQKALAKRPDERFGSAAEMGEAIRDLRFSLIEKREGWEGWGQRVGNLKAVFGSRARGLVGDAIAGLCARAGIRIEQGF